MSTIAILSFILSYITLGGAHPISWALLIATFGTLAYETNTLRKKP